MPIKPGLSLWHEAMFPPHEITKTPNKEKGTKAYRAVENADYQTQANAFRSLFNEINETVRKLESSG